MRIKTKADVSTPNFRSLPLGSILRYETEDDGWIEITVGNSHSVEIRGSNGIAVRPLAANSVHIKLERKRIL